MSTLAVIPVPARSPAPTRPRRHLQLVTPGFVPPASPVRSAGRPVTGDRRAPSVRLTARGRAVVATAAFLVAAAIAVALGTWAAHAVAPPVGPTTSVTVTAGQTLWGIAGGIAAPGEDVRDVVDDILALNALSSADLRPGQRLVVPAS